MQDESKLLYETVANIFKNIKEDSNQKFTNFCIKNGLPPSTYDDILNARTQATLFNIFKIIRAHRLSWEKFGKLLDEKLPEEIWNS